MGLTCIFLVEKGSNIGMKNLLMSISNLCKENEGELYFASGKGKEYVLYCTIGNKPFDGSDESFDKQIGVYLYEEISEPEIDRSYFTFKFEEHQKPYYGFIFTEDFDEREDVLFKFAYEFLKKYPNVKVYTDSDWLYSLEDLEKINNRPFDENWCYTDPKLLL